MPDIFVQSFTHLKDKPNADKALHMLQRIASLVKPIMRKRSWVLPVLSEFFPDSPNLLGLNVNMGQKILVRLRPPFSPDTFMSEEDVVQTMLHELTHNVHGPHDDKFYKYLAGLQDEYDALQRSGYAGEGFFSDGKRLGTNVSHNVSPHMARLKALEAAEKRAQTSRVLGSGGRLGGVSRTAGLSPRELAAKAAERRIRDEKSCASGADAEREAAKVAKDSVVNNVIDLTLSSDEEEHDHLDIVIVKDIHPRPGPSTKVPARPQPSNSKPIHPTPYSKPSVPAPSTSRPTASTTSTTTKQPPKPAHQAPKEVPRQTHSTMRRMYDKETIRGAHSEVKTRKRLVMLDVWRDGDAS
ncbi:hypothetical protein D9619_002813 [Psilocybe cf. subviscida]|uniref:WLM domain-containing protein n=1 Tax=Psilocybe cf. subviscida TaxID=2480587 RepID=A0A8H5AZ49_9AGAR|nr:hypothetical protein D9619_002813 [Psilocybe cf. subviscida]